MANKNIPSAYMRTNLVINRRTKTATLFWQEDYVNTNAAGDKGNCDVVSKIKSETFSYSARVDIEGLNRLLDIIGYHRGRKTRGYSYKIN